jgi:hypothetical protein
LSAAALRANDPIPKPQAIATAPDRFMIACRLLA